MNPSAIFAFRGHALERAFPWRLPWKFAIPAALKIIR